MATMITSGQSSLMLKLLKTSNEFYRATYVVSAIVNGVYEAFTGGRTTLPQLAEKLNKVTNREGLHSWLELGVSLGELDRSGDVYRITGSLSKALLDPVNDGYQAMIEEIVRHHYRYIMETPAKLRAHALFPFDEASGRLIARSSRVSEPLIFEVVDTAVPSIGNFDLLEVGCGSGTYIRRACGRNRALRAVGLELQEQVAVVARKNIAAWKLENRAIVEHCDVRKYHSDRAFDLVTFHQNIYYFPVADRVALGRHVLGLLKPGGRVLLTTVGQGGGPAGQALNVWVSTTEGYGPLPDPDTLCRQLGEAGYTDVSKKRLVPFESFWSFTGTKPLA